MMGLNEALTVIGLAITGLTLFAGAAWWMSALYATVKQIGGSLGRLNEQMDKQAERTERQIEQLWQAHNQLAQQVAKEG